MVPLLVYLRQNQRRCISLLLSVISLFCSHFSLLSPVKPSRWNLSCCHSLALSTLFFHTSCQSLSCFDHTVITYWSKFHLRTIFLPNWFIYFKGIQILIHCCACWHFSLFVPLGARLPPPPPSLLTLDKSSGISVVSLPILYLYLLSLFLQFKFYCCPI